MAGTTFIDLDDDAGESAEQVKPRRGRRPGA